MFSYAKVDPLDIDIFKPLKFNVKHFTEPNDQSLNVLADHLRAFNGRKHNAFK